jgi:hypothetical protein
MSNKRLGYHYYPDDHHYSQEDLETWLPRLHSLGARWLTLQSNDGRTVPEAFVRGLLEANIQPVIHITSQIGAVQPADLIPLFSSYRSWGVNHVVVFDRPNLKRSWGEASWSKRGLVERFLDAAMPILEASHAAGLRPTLPPLEPGGDYWDTAFLEQLLRGLMRRGKHGLLGELTLAIYAWTHHRPLDWGIGGPDQWPDARPYHTPAGCQDQLGLRAFDWYASISNKVMQSPIPMLVVAGGAYHDGLQQVPPSPDDQAEQNLSIARSLENETIPSQVLNFNFYPLTTAQDHPDAGRAWFPIEGPHKPVVEALRGYVKAEEMAPLPNRTNKVIDHYVLLPEASSPDFHQRWAALGALVLTSKPIIGFSSDIALEAKKVTIIGDENQVPAPIERALRNAGCEVQRVPHLIAPKQPGSPAQLMNPSISAGAPNVRI